MQYTYHDNFLHISFCLNIWHYLLNSNMYLCSNHHFLNLENVESMQCRQIQIHNSFHTHKRSKIHFLLDLNSTLFIFILCKVWVQINTNMNPVLKVGHWFVSVRYKEILGKWGYRHKIATLEQILFMHSALHTVCWHDNDIERILHCMLYFV